MRLLGIPLHLWSQKIFKQIGDLCGGWIETEEEAILRNLLKWARIKVKGLELMPTLLQGPLNFLLPSLIAMHSWETVAKEELALHVGYDEEDLTPPLGGEIVPFSPLPLNAHQLIDCKDLEYWLVDASGPLDSHFLEADMNASL